jgi:undecaprenyl-diphosphatase
MLIVVSIFFFMVERWGGRHKNMQSLTWRGMILVACAQALALIPGTSRSGITIVAGMASGLTREAAARFSFLMGIPIIFLAGVKKIYDLSVQGVEKSELELYALGIVVSAIVGYLAIKYFLKFIQNHTLAVFAWYRIVLAVIIVLFLL